MVEQITFRPIGVIRTPYKDWAPHQPVERFSHIYVLSFLKGTTRLSKDYELKTWA